MSNPTPVQRFESTWPDKLRALKVNDTLHIPGDQLTIAQVRSLVSNMNTRLKGRAVYKSLSEKSTGDSVICCVFRKKGTPLRQRVPRRARTEQIAAPLPTTKVPKPTKRKRSEAFMPKPMEAFAIVECTYVNGGAQSMRAADQNELELLLERCRANDQVTEITTFQRASVMRKQVSWAAADASA